MTVGAEVAHASIAAGARRPSRALHDATVSGQIWIRAPGLLAWPHAWQRPARTEEWAFEQAAAQMAAPRFAQVVAFPWATLLDLQDRDLHGRARRNLDALSRVPPRTTLIRATVCQHINAHRAWPWLHGLGITDVFWSHARIDGTELDGIRIHPFPLYPVRCLDRTDAAPLLDVPPSRRRLLYSFVGAYSPAGYLTPVRQWIFDLPQRPDALVVRRSEWHYEADVYRVQVAGQAIAPDEQARRDRHGDDYDATLLDSIFSLCPSGSGPNSIRLWESLGFGCIPVLLADTLRLPGTSEEWDDAIVRVPESPEAVAGLPARLEALARDPQRLQRMREAGRRLWVRYGENGPRTVLGVLSDLQWIRSRVAEGVAQVRGAPVP